MRAKKLLIIVGQMRAGGSAVAEVVHSLGVPVGLKFLAPTSPTWRCEWEDWDLAEALVNSFLHPENGGGVDNWEEWFEAYLGLRLISQEQWDNTMGTSTEWLAMKGPLMLMVLDELRSAAVAVGLDPHVLVVNRKTRWVYESMRRTFEKLGSGKVAREFNKDLAKLISRITPDYEIDYAGLAAHPTTPVRDLAEYMGIDDEERILDATSRVRAPTTTITETLET